MTENEHRMTKRIEQLEKVVVALVKTIEWDTNLEPQLKQYLADENIWISFPLEGSNL